MREKLQRLQEGPICIRLQMDQMLQKIYFQVLRLRPGQERGRGLQNYEELWSPRLREVWRMISAQSATFGCLLLSLPIRAALGVPFWRGFLGIHFKSMYIDFLSSHRHCVQLSQPALAYVTASLLPPCPRSHFSSLSPVTLEGSSPARRASSPPRSPRPPWARRLSLEARPYPALPWPPPGRVPEQASSPRQ